MPNKRNPNKLSYRRKVLKIPLEYKKKYCEILSKELIGIMAWASFQIDGLEFKLKTCLSILFLSKKGWNRNTMAEVRDRYKEDFPKIFPHLNYVQMTWSVHF